MLKRVLAVVYRFLVLMAFVVALFSPISIFIIFGYTTGGLLLTFAASILLILMVAEFGEDAFEFFSKIDRKIIE